MIRHHLGHTTRRMLMVDKAMTFPLAGINTYIDCVVDGVKGCNIHIRWVGSLTSHDDAVVCIQTVLVHLPGKHRDDIPALIFHSHMQIQLGIRAAHSKLCKTSNCNVNSFTELIPVSVKDNKIVRAQANCLPTLKLVFWIELTSRNAVGNDSDRTVDAPFYEFVGTKFRIANHSFPSIGVISKASQPVVAIHWAVSHKLKLALLVVVLNLLVNFINNPHVIVNKHKIRLNPFNHFPDTLLTKTCGLETVRRGIHRELFLPRRWVTPPVIA